MNWLTLGIETSGFSGSIALQRAGRTLETTQLDLSGRRHAQTLISEVASLLERHELTTKQVQLIAVSIGPGSFTGLRVGVVCAKTLAYALGCKVVAVDSFHAIAAASPDNIGEVFVVSDAQRGDLFVGHFVRQSPNATNKEWHRNGTITIERTDDWIVTRRDSAESQSSLAISGPAAEVLRSRLSDRILVLPPSLQQPRADIVATLGEQLAKKGDFADLWTLEPFYLRRSAAEEKSSLV